MIHYRSTIILLTLIMPITLLSCYGYYVEDQSVPEISENLNVKGSSDHRFCTFQLDDVNLSVIPKNYKLVFGSEGLFLPIIPHDSMFKSKKDNRDPFVIEIKLFPKPGPLRFEPMKLSLILESEAYHPSGYRKMTYSHQGTLGECETICDYGDGFIDNNDIIIIEDNVCFEIQFPIETFRTEDEFSLNFRGLSKDWEKLDIPTIQFRKKRNRRYLHLRM